MVSLLKSAASSSATVWSPSVPGQILQIRNIQKNYLLTHYYGVTPTWEHWGRHEKEISTYILKFPKVYSFFLNLFCSPDKRHKQNKTWYLVNSPLDGSPVFTENYSAWIVSLLCSAWYTQGLFLNLYQTNFICFSLKASYKSFKIFRFQILIVSPPLYLWIRTGDHTDFWSKVF